MGLIGAPSPPQAPMTDHMSGKGPASEFSTSGEKSAQPDEGPKTQKPNTPGHVFSLLAKSGWEVFWVVSHVRKNEGFQSPIRVVSSFLHTWETTRIGDLNPSFLHTWETTRIGDLNPSFLHTWEGSIPQSGSFPKYARMRGSHPQTHPNHPLGLT